MALFDFETECLLLLLGGCFFFYRQIKEISRHRHIHIYELPFIKLCRCAANASGTKLNYDAILWKEKRKVRITHLYLLSALYIRIGVVLFRKRH